MIRATRLPGNPLLTPASGRRMGDNLNGPSVIRVPDWLPGKLGDWYCYFAHHDGDHIRLAVADRPEGPWRVHEPGVLSVAEAGFSRHVASPDVHVDADLRRIRMYVHGCCFPTPPPQRTRVALSADGLHFAIRPTDIGRPYFRVFAWAGWHWAVVQPAQILRSRDGIDGWEEAGRLDLGTLRHNAVDLHGDGFDLYFTRIGDAPERILRRRITLAPAVADWRIGASEEVLAPELPYEGADAPHEASRSGRAHGPAWQLRDPCIVRDGDRRLLFYACAGESGLAAAHLHGD